MQTQQAALADDFQSRLDQPGYRPSNRLIVRHDKKLLAHVHLANHIAWFEGQRIPVVNLEDFAVLPEYSDSAYDEQLLAVAKSIASAEGAVLALVHTDRTDWFQRRGWSAWRGQGHTRANARTVLAHLDPHTHPKPRRRSGIEVRLWRHFELDHIRRVYAEAAAELWGPLYRSEENWQWLMGRKAEDQILVAVQRGGAAGNGSTLNPPPERAVGYAIMRGSAVVELMTLPSFNAARVQLLIAACRDAIDRNHNSISLFTPATDPLHELLVTAGGAWLGDRASRSPAWMARLLAPERWVERLYVLWRERAQDAGVPRPFEIGLAVGNAKYRFALTRRSSRLEPSASLPSPWAACDQPLFEQLLTGNLSISHARADGRLRLSDASLEGPLSAVFAPRLFWQSSLELMRL
ncbi:MAG: hypothetical protein IT424_04415 [Pirellulales bacterium]|nr:hypothetical protein [Pirellulales bacterium]